MIREKLAALPAAHKRELFIFLVAMVLSIVTVWALSSELYSARVERHQARAEKAINAAEALEDSLQVAEVRLARTAAYAEYAERQAIEMSRLLDEERAHYRRESQAARTSLVESRTESTRYIESGRPLAECPAVLDSCLEAREALARALDQADRAQTAADSALAASRRSAEAARGETRETTRLLVLRTEQSTQYRTAAEEYERALEAALARRPPLLALSVSGQHVPAPTFGEGWRLGPEVSLTLGRVQAFGGYGLDPVSGDHGPTFGASYTIWSW